MIELGALPEKNAYSDDKMLEIRRQRDVYHRHIGTVVLVEAAKRRGLRTTWVSKSLAIAEDTPIHRRVLLAGYRGRISRIGSAVTTDKLLTKSFLFDAQIPTPRGKAVHTAQDAIEFQIELGARVVIKPRSSYGGNAVRVALQSPEEIEAAWNDAREFGEVLAEEYVEVASEYRCLATPEKCVSVVARIPPWVEGDGISTIRELIERKNILRNELPSTHSRLIPVDDATESTLSDQHLALTSVLENNRRVTVRNVGGLTNGGEPFEYSRCVNPRVPEIAAEAAKALPGVEWAGVDVMESTSGEHYIVEINSSPDSLGSVFPYYGAPVDIPDYMVRSRIYTAPVVSATEPVLPDPKGELVGVLKEEGVSIPSVALSFLLRRFLKREGWTVTRLSKTLYRGRQRDKPDLWIRETSTTSDLDLVQRAVHRHSVARTLLRNEGVPLAAARTISSFSQDEAPPSLQEKDHVYIRPAERWIGRAARASGRTSTERGNSSRRGVWIQQERVEGRRYSALATSSELVTLVGTASVSSQELLLIADTATRAVRAVPELRWCCVDVVLPSIGADGTCNVEGLSLNPVFGQDDKVLAGALSSLWPIILADKPALSHTVSQV